MLEKSLGKKKFLMSEFPMASRNERTEHSSTWWITLLSVLNVYAYLLVVK